MSAPAQLLPEDAEERAVWDRSLATMDQRLSPLRMVAQILRIWSRVQGGTMGKVCAIMHNEIIKYLECRS